MAVSGRTRNFRTSPHWTRPLVISLRCVIIFAFLAELPTCLGVPVSVSRPLNNAMETDKTLLIEKLRMPLAKPVHGHSAEWKSYPNRERDASMPKHVYSAISNETLFNKKVDAPIPEQVGHFIGEMNKTAVHKEKMTLRGGTVSHFNGKINDTPLPKPEENPAETNKSYYSERMKFLLDESQLVIGAHLDLNPQEMAVDRILLAAKGREVLMGLNNGTIFPPSVNFLTGKGLVEKSAVFDIIKRMPKGGILHIHETAMADPEWVVSQITYLPHLYFCVVHDYFSSLHFKFSTVPPHSKSADCISDWKLVSLARSEVGAEKFDKMLYQNFTMIVDDPDEAYPNGTMAWMRFTQTLGSLTDLFFYTHTLPLFLKNSFEGFVADNVQHVEIRTLLLPLLDSNGTMYPPEYTLQQFIQAIKEFQAENPKDFSGAKIISSSVRHPVNKTFIFQQVREAMMLRQNYPQYFAGYDLVGEEDLGGPLIAYISELLYPSQHGFNLPYFFHAGETDWEGTMVDQNLIDAILLNTSRIGHGYAINKHPKVMAAVKERNIPIEINPISNQVLGLVHDLRNHMGTHLIADDYPIVVSSDDPGVWGALPLSHDYYMAFMGMSGKNVGLKLLKQLALNTIEFSAMSNTEKVAARELWQAKWNNFIDEVLSKYGKPAGLFT